MDSKDNEEADVGTGNGATTVEQEQGRHDATPANGEARTATTPMTAVAAAEDPTGRTTTSQEQQQQPLSKNQQKKKRRLERMLAVKKRRKQQEKEAKAERAAARGRDVEAERAQQAANQAAGDGKRRRDERWSQHWLKAKQNFQVCLDCAFQDAMTAKEITSLALQIRYCYATNRRAAVPTSLAATSVTGETREHLERVSGFDEWRARAFTCTERPLEEYYRDRHADLVYLTSDSENVLTELDTSKVYIIGGIVDRNRLKRAAITRAESLRIATAKLPLDDHLKRMESTRVLTCNHVFDILMHYSQHNDWEKALVSVLPPRKGAQLASLSGDGNNDEAGAKEGQPSGSESATTEDAEQHKDDTATKESESSL